jgi:Tfp pilus assembly protein PilO
MWLPSITKVTSQLRPGGISRSLRATALVCAGLLCANLLLFGFLVAPLTSRLAAGEARSAELRRRHAEAVLFEKQKASLAGLMAGMPAQKDMPLLVKEFAQIARSRNLSVASIKYDMPKRASGELAMLAFSFPVEGRYADIKRFIYEVETSDRFVGIQDLKLGSEQGRVKLEMKLVTYVKGR